MKVRSAVRRLCRDCYVIKRKRVVYIRCKTVKKHKQRQGFHTEAAVSAWEGGHAHDLGACKCDGGVAALSAPDRHHSPIGALHNLPWAPSWASMPAPSRVEAVSSESSESIALRAAGLQASSALRALGLWASSVFSQIRGDGR